MKINQTTPCTYITHTFFHDNCNYSGSCLCSCCIHKFFLTVIFGVITINFLLVFSCKKDNHALSLCNPLGHFPINVTRHFLLIKPSFVSSCFQFLVNDGHTLMIVAAWFIFPPVMRKKDIGARFYLRSTWIIVIRIITYTQSTCKIVCINTKVVKERLLSAPKKIFIFFGKSLYYTAAVVPEILQTF